MLPAQLIRSVLLAQLTLNAPCPANTLSAPYHICIAYENVCSDHSLEKHQA